MTDRSRMVNVQWTFKGRNREVGGVDGLQVGNLKTHLRLHGAAIIGAVRSGSYQPKPIKGVEIPKSNGKTRLLGVPTVVDRVLQQAVLQSQRYINEGNQYIVDIDLKSFFDEVGHTILLDLIYKKVKCKLTLQL